MKRSGFLLIDKPCGPTSMTVVRKVKRHLGMDHVGHLGTLDPFASGLLPVLLGGAARLSDQVVDGKKGYEFRISLGSETDTLDPSGQVVRTAEVPRDWRERVEGQLGLFLGEIEQVPPLYSAIKMDGLALYEHMRSKGGLPRDIETKRRRITIFQLRLLAVASEGDHPWVDLQVVCSKGTYVRSLARDLALAVGTVGHCSVLRRTLVEPWSVTEAQTLEAFEATNPDSLVILPPQALLPHVPCVTLGSEYEKALGSGNVIFCPVQAMGGWASLDRNAGVHPVLLGCGEILFYAEAESLEGDGVKLQPRKRIS